MAGMIYLYIILGIVILLVARSFLRIHLAGSVEYSHNSLGELKKYIGNWSKGLGKNGAIMVTHADYPFIVEFRRKLYKTKSDELLFEVRRSTNEENNYFTEVLTEFEKSEYDVAIDLSYARKEKKTIRVKMEIDSDEIEQESINLIEKAFSIFNNIDDTGYIIWVAGDFDFSAYSDDSLIPPNNVNKYGFSLGSYLKRIISSFIIYSAI